MGFPHVIAKCMSYGENDSVFSNDKIIKWESIDYAFSMKEKVDSFPNCIHMKLIRPKNLHGLSFASFKSMKKLEISYRDSKMATQEIESDIAKFFNLLKESPPIDAVCIDVPSMTMVFFT